MVDRKGRNKLIGLFDSYLSCEINNFQFDTALYNLEDLHNIDPVIPNVNLQLYFIYDDLRKHWNREKYKISEEQLSDINRIIEFLKTDLLFEWPTLPNESFITRLKKWFISSPEVEEVKVDASLILEEAYWPFLNRAQYIKYKG